MANVQQTSESYVTVKVNNRKAKQIRYGMEAQLEDKEKGQGYIESTKEEQGCVDDSESAVIPDIVLMENVKNQKDGKCQ